MNEIRNSNKVKKRIGWVDMAKGVAILSVIIGHTLCMESLVENMWRGVIFSFHMPLFFILSAFTFQFSINTEQFGRNTVRAFKHLIIPTLCLFAIQTVLDLLKETGVSDWQFWKDKAMKLLFASGVDVHIADYTVPAMGMLWFLAVLFSARSLYDWLQLNIKSCKFYIILSVFTCLGVICGQYLQLPFSFDIALAVLPFFGCGQMWKNRQKTISSISTWLLLLVWVSTLVLMFAVNGNYLELACRTYPLFPLSHLTAVVGVFIVGKACQCIVEKRENLCKPLMFLGKNSFLLLGVHYLDKNYEMIWRVCENNYCNLTVRICIDVMLMIVGMKIYKYVLTFKNR